jgi:hypothetical protein
MAIQKTLCKKVLPLAILFTLLISNLFAQKIVRYDVKDTIVNFTGKAKRAIAVNGQIPMPTLTFTEGDTAEIYVHNEMNEETSLHWHGLFYPTKKMVYLILHKCPSSLILHIFTGFQLFKTVHIGIIAIQVCKNK